MQVRYRLLGLITLTLTWMLSCQGPGSDPYEGADPLAPGPKLGKADGAGVKALPVSVDASSTRVWTVVNQWQDTDTEAARQAGIAWPADSGLNWDEKFAAWVGNLQKIPVHDSKYSKTFELATPWGKKIPAPSLDCADVWIFLRATFAAWYQLPFYMEAVDYKKVNGKVVSTRVFFGHFGIRTASGNWNGMPLFASYYNDYSSLAAQKTPEQLIADWPTDAKLRSRGTIEGDDQPFLGEGARMGAYLDEVHLNKRAGHFIRILLIYFGTPNLADSHNTFNLVPDAVREGDAMLYRRASDGSGHTMVVLRVGKNAAGLLTVQVASGNVPPRQPSWESEAASKSRFTNNEGGGPTTNSKGEVYAELGGGLKRWRVAKKVSGYWMNTFMQGDEASWIDDTDYKTLGERPGIFKQILGEVPPEEKKQALLTMIADARRHLEQYPASCAARERREQAFGELYDLMMSYPFNKTKQEVDQEFRTKADYVFAELVYEKSKTCCWNSSNATMYNIIMDYVETLEKNAPLGSCSPPPVFMATGGGYDAFASHAAATGHALAWKPWSDDESCPQKNVADDTEADHLWTDYCQLGLTSTPQPPPDAGAADAGVDTIPPDPDAGAANSPGADAGVPSP